MTTTQPIALPSAAERAEHDPTQSITPRARFGFILAIVAQIAMMIAASAPSPFYPVLAQDIGFDAIVIAAVFAVYAIVLLDAPHRRLPL
ncbi:hypothetical protein [Microbacterium sp. SA39]|uniref:hypothetical protein n=1 Tax=Microbacterium sp. SA39 TaxID=1263625 RepID=UPI0006200F5E|nr:hypothetical protein [Microbacterium sp. SA39]KJQ54342.1 hypothetical protein RS85_01944 [Microbacterium sp. SA39]